MLEATLTRNTESIAELDGIVRNSSEKYKALEAELTLSGERLQRQLEREAAKGNEFTMVDYSVHAA